MKRFHSRRPAALSSGLLSVWFRLFGFLCAAAGMHGADCSVLDRLTNVLPKLTSEDLYAVTVNGGTFYAVGSHGAALKSSDGRTWQNSRPATPNSLIAVAAGGPGVVAVGEAGTVVFSPDGAAWTAGSVTPKTNLTSVAFGNEVFVAVGAGGNAFTSADGKAWVAQATGTTNDLVRVAFGSGVFVAAGKASEVYVSTDGIGWIRYRLAAPLVHLRPVSGGFFGMSADNRVASSIDGRVWSLVAKHPLTNVTDISADGGRLYASGTAGSIFSSANSTVWNPLTLPAIVGGRDIFGIAFDNGTGIAVGEQGLLLGIDVAGTVVNLNTDKFDDLNAATFGNGWFVAVGKSGRIMAAQGATNTWQFPDSGTTNDLAGVAFGLGRFIAVGGAFTNSLGSPHASILASPNGTNWTTILRQDALTNGTTGELAWPTSVAFGNSRFVAVAPQGAALISTNGTDWTFLFDPLLVGCGSIGYAGDRFVAVGTNIITSTDGIAWSASLSTPGEPLVGIAGTVGKIVAVGTNPVVTLSTNLTTPWVPNKLAVKGGLGGVAYGGSQFVAAGAAGAIYTSFDGATWVKHNGNTPSFLRGVAYGDGYYVVVGDRGTVIVSTRVDPNSGLPGPSAWVRTAGGTERDAAFAVALDPACGFYMTGSFRREVDFSGGGTVTGTEDPSFFLTRYTDIGAADWTTIGTGLAWGTRMAAIPGQVFAAGVAQGGITFDGGEVLAGDGLGAFVAGFGADGAPAWVRQFPGTVSDLITTKSGSLRFAGTFPQKISFGDELLIESTNTPTSFFLIKADAVGTNVWGRFIEPTKGFLDGLKLASDSTSATYAAGTANGLLNFWEVQVVVPPTDPGTGEGGEGGGDPGAGGITFSNVLSSKITISNGPSVFLSKYDANGKFLWVTNTGLQGAILTGAAADGSGGALLAGNAGTGMFVARFATNGAPIWRKDFNTAGNAQLTAFTSTTNGWSIGAGFFQGDLRIGTTDLTTGGTACFVFRLDTNGVIQTVQSYGTADADAGYSAPTALAAESTREYTLAGYYDERVSFGPGELVTRGLSDIFLARLRTPPESGGFIIPHLTADGLELDFPPGYVLQFSPTVEPADWSNILGNPPITVEPDSAPGFYRLIWP